MYGPMMYEPMGPMMGRAWEQMWQWMRPLPTYVAVGAMVVLAVALVIAVVGLVAAIRQERDAAGRAPRPS